MAVCEHGICKVKILMFNGKEANINGICLDKITHEFPKYELQEVGKDIQKEYEKGRFTSKNKLPKLPRSVGGNTDFMIDIKYLKYYPKEIFHLPSGLTIYESVFSNADASRGVIGGPHGIFAEIEKQFRGPHLNMTAYLNNHSTFMNRQLRSQKKFEVVESAGTEVLYRCVKCRNCPSCTTSEQIEYTSIQEEVEQDLINRSVTVDIEKGQTIARLPFIKDPLHRLSPNEKVALKIYKSQVRKLENCPEDQDEVIKSGKKVQELGFADFYERLTDEQKWVISKSSIKHFIPW